MEYVSNMEQFFPEKKLTISDPFLPSFPMELLNDTWNQNTQNTASLSVSRESPRISVNHSKRYIRKHWSKDSSNDNTLKMLLHQKLVDNVIHGQPFESLQFHRQKLLEEVSEWIGVSYTDENDDVRHKLLNLLAKASKQSLKDIPSNISEWTKLLNKWVKVNSSKNVLCNREIYKILAVDGFRGTIPKSLNKYLSNVLNPLRKEYKLHVRGVRRMYDFFEENDGVSSLTGTDSASVVFLALLEWYSIQMKNDLMLDDQVTLQVKQTKLWAEGNLQQHREYYPDVRNVDAKLLRAFGKIYEEVFKDDNDDSWKIVGRDLLLSLDKL